MEKIYLVIEKINTFVYLIERISNITLPRISDCLLAINKLAFDDINSIHEIIVDYAIWEKSRRSLSPKKIQYFWDIIFATLPATVSESNDTEIPDGVTRNKHILPVSLDISSPIDIYDKTNLNKTTQNVINNDDIDTKQCQKVYDEMKQILIQVMAGESSDQRDGAPSSHNQYHFHDAYDLHQRHVSYDCWYDLEVVRNEVIGELKKISTDTEHSMYTAQGMDNDGFWNVLREDVDNLKAISEWWSGQLESYATNKTTKNELSNTIGRHTFSRLELSLGRLISAITTKGIEPLLAKTSALDKNIPIWYKKTVGILQMSVANYEDRGMKSLHIWRHPVAKLETEKTLKFKYSVFDAWRSWEMSTTLDNFFVTGNAGTYISTVTKEFTNTLLIELLRLKMQLTDKRYEVIQSINAVISDFTDIQRERSTDKNFVL